MRAGASGQRTRHDALLLLASDDAHLKRAARSMWPAALYTTSLVPTQPGYCDTSPSEHRINVLRTVAELFLLASSHALVFGRWKEPHMPMPMCA